MIYEGEAKEEQFVLDLPIIGFAASFPSQANAKPVEYRVSGIYWKQEYEMSE
jgi:hypothetical protein